MFWLSILNLVLYNYADLSATCNRYKEKGNIIIIKIALM